MIQYFPIVTGSLTVLGNINVSGSITTSGSITISGSITSASFATSASNATNAISASYANNLTVAGTLTAQTLVVQTITSSVDFVTGSTRFGSLSSNTHQFTGSLFITGSSTTIGTASFQTSGNNGVINLGGNTYYGQVKVDSNLGGIQINSIWGGANSGIIQLTNGTAGNVRLHIADAGNIGIGTSTPTNGKLEVQTGATAAGLWVQTGGTTTGYTIADFRTGTNLSALKILGNGSCEFGGSLTVGKLFSTYNGSQFINTSSGLVNYIDLSTIMSNHDSAIISIGQGNDNKLAKATVIVQRTAYTSGVTYSVATLGTQPIAAYLSFAINGSYLQMQTTAANATYYYNALVIPAY